MQSKDIKMLSMPSESFTRVMRFVRFISSCVGADTYDINYHFNKITALTIFVVCVYVTFTLLTVVEEMNWMFTLQAVVMSGTVVQAVTKLIVVICNADKVYEINHSIHELYEEYENYSDPRFSKVLFDCSRRVRDILIVTGIIYVLGIALLILMPLVATKLTGKLNLIMHFHIPYIDVETESGIWITQAVHLLSVIVGGIGMYAGDAIIFVHLMLPMLFVDILRIKVDIFNTFVEDPDSVKSESRTEKMLVGITRFHQKYLRFISQCNKLFYVIVSVQFASAAFCIVLTMFALLTSDWPGGYGYGVIVVQNMYINCILGTVLEYCNDDFMYEIYNISFYNLSVSQQRLVLLMLCKSQNPDMILLLGVEPLAVSTALQATKGIYSIGMMMMQFLKT